MPLRRSHTAIIERNVVWEGAYETEPYEAAWASEAIYFVRVLASEGMAGSVAKVQISPDGIHWADEGSHVPIGTATDEVTFGKVIHFGTYLRLVGELPEGATARVIVSLSLKE